MFLRRFLLPAAMLLACIRPVVAQDWDSLTQMQTDEIIGSVTTDFYHEMGHALIDILQIPILGAEEDAADSLSIYLITTFWEDADAQAIVSASLATWDALYGPNAGEEPDYWDVHAPDGKRIATMSCLFYGVSPETRADFAEARGIPDERAESCPEEYLDLDASWAAYLDPLIEGGGGSSIVFEDPEAETPITEAIRAEVDYFNDILALPNELTVRVHSCGEANAYYHGYDRSISICTELAQQVLDRMVE
jgi:hypothetical protein